MITLLAAAALAAPQAVVVDPESIPGACMRDYEEGADEGFEAPELEELADCLAFYNPDGPLELDRVERGVSMFRQAMAMRGVVADEPPIPDEHLYLILLAYADNGFVTEFRREAEAQSFFLDTAEEFRCGYFQRLEMDLRDRNRRELADWLSQRFALQQCRLYVPEDGWTNWAGQPGNEKHWFYERWFGGQLSAMGEQPLIDDGDLGDFVYRFRYLVLPSFEPAYAVRIDEDRVGGLHMTWTLLDGAGGYAPGRVQETGYRQLTQSEAQQLIRLLERTDLANLQMEEGPPEPRSDGRIVVCADGTTYVFEELAQGRRNFVERRFCGRSDPELVALIEHFGELLPNERFERY